MSQDAHEHGQPTDAELLTRMSAGDREAFAVLFRRHQRSVYRFSMQMTGAADVAEDITQDVFMALARGGSRYESRQGAFSTYLYGIARHLVLQREKGRRARHEVALDERAAPPALHDPLEQIDRSDKVAALRRAILRLPPHYREAIVLCELHELPYDVAAAIVGCPVGTIRSRLNRARRLLADRYRAWLSTRSPVESADPVPWIMSRRPRVVEPQS